MIGGVGFDVYNVIGGTAVGVYATDDEAIQAKLDALVADPKNAVTSISQGEYEACVSKKVPAFSNYKPSSVSVPMLPTGGPLKGAGAVVVAAKSEEDEAELPVRIVGEVTSIDDVLKTAVVEPPAQEQAVEQAAPTPAAPVQEPAKQVQAHKGKKK